MPVADIWCGRDHPELPLTEKERKAMIARHQSDGTILQSTVGRQHSMAFTDQHHEDDQERTSTVTGTLSGQPVTVYNVPQRPVPARHQTTRSELHAASSVISDYSRGGHGRQQDPLSTVFGSEAGMSSVATKQKGKVSFM